MQNQIKWSILVLILLHAFLGCHTLYAQPDIQIVFPSNGEENVSTEPIIQIAIPTPYVLDYSCIDTTEYSEEIPWDSLNNRFYFAQIAAFEQDYYSGTDSSLMIASLMGEICYGKIIDNRHFEIYTKGLLRKNTLHGIAFGGLRVYDPSTMDTISIDSVINNAFRTEYPLHKVSNVSIPEDGMIIKDEQIAVYFNRKLNSATTPAGNLLSISDVSTTITSTVSSTSVLTEDSLGVIITPDSDFVKNNYYKLDIFLDRVTGDEKDHVSLPFRCKSWFSVSVEALIRDTTDTLPPSCHPIQAGNTYTLTGGDTLHLSTGQYIGEYMFVGWESLDVDKYHSSTLTELDVTLSDTELKDFTLTAIYARTPKDEFTILDPSTPEGYVEIYSDFETLPNSTYALPREQGSFITIRAIPNPGYVFSYWYSDDPEFNGKTEPLLMIGGLTDRTRKAESSTTKSKNKTQAIDPASDPINAMKLNNVRIGVTPVFELEPPPDPTYKACVDFYYNKHDLMHDYQGDNDKTDILSIVNSVVFTYSGNSETIACVRGSSNNVAHACCYPIVPMGGDIPMQVDVGLINDDYEITVYYSKDRCFRDIKGGEFTGYYNSVYKSYEPVGSDFTENFTLTPGCRQCHITVHIERKKQVLTWSYSLIDNEMLPTLKMDVITEVDPSTPCRTHPMMRETKVGYDEFGNIAYGKDIVKIVKTKEFWKGTIVRLVPVLTQEDETYSFEEWVEGEGLTSEPIIDEDNLVLLVTMNKDKESHALGSGKFRVIRVGYLKKRWIEVDGTMSHEDYLNYENTNDYEYYYPDNASDNAKVTDYQAGLYYRTGKVKDDPNDLLNDGYEYRTTRAHIEFSDEPNLNTLINGTIFTQDVHARKEVGIEKQLIRFEPDRIEEGDPPMPIEGNGYLNGKNVYFNIYDVESEIGLEHRSNVKLYISSQIENLDTPAETLSVFSPNEFTTEYPGINIYLDKYKARDKEDWGNDELFMHFHFALYSKDNYSSAGTEVVFGPGRVIQHKLRHPAAGTISTGKGDTKTIDKYLVIYPRLWPESIIGVGGCFIDEDAGDAVEKGAEIMAETTKIIAEAYPNEWTVGAAIAAAAAAEMAKSWKDPDDALGDFNILWEEDRFWSFDGIYQTEQVQKEGHYYRITIQRVLK